MTTVYRPEFKSLTVTAAPAIMLAGWHEATLFKHELLLYLLDKLEFLLPLWGTCSAHQYSPVPRGCALGHDKGKVALSAHPRPPFSEVTIWKCRWRDG